MQARVSITGRALTIWNNNTGNDKQYQYVCILFAFVWLVSSHRLARLVLVLVLLLLLLLLVSLLLLLLLWLARSLACARTQAGLETQANGNKWPSEVRVREAEGGAGYSLGRIRGSNVARLPAKSAAILPSVPSFIRLANHLIPLPPPLLPTEQAAGRPASCSRPREGAECVLI